MADQVLSPLQYLRNDPLYEKEKPYQIQFDVTNIPDAIRSNHRYEAATQVPITNVRTHKPEVRLDREGFQLVELPDLPDADNFDDNNWIKTNFYGYIGGFVKQLLGAQDFKVIGHRLRHSAPGFNLGEAENPTLLANTHHSFPVPVVHTDFSARAAQSRLRKYWPLYAEQSQNGLWHLIQVWLPLTDVVTEWPLAICDGQSVEPKDLRPSDLVRRDNQMETIYCIRNTKHRWFYADRQRFGEAWIMNFYDSKPGFLCGALHSAFDIGQGRSTRKSCEVTVAVHIQE